MTSKNGRLASIFYYNGLASLAKSLAFRSMAIYGRKKNERISATVSAYYSLLHLAIALMYFDPNEIEEPLRSSLLNKRKDGKTDPSKIIKHDLALQFIKKCTQEGLDRKFSTQFEYAKRFREFVNYGPRITISDGKPSFGPCDDSPGDSDRLVSSLDEIFQAAISWANNNSPLEGVLVKTALSQCEDFFQKPDLFYTQWCSNFSVDTAMLFIKKLIKRLSP
ncbi:MAG TPA: hypothetical protein ENI23_02775 [bacterium]|nr:hypothetical protein [bacterium]